MMQKGDKVRFSGAEANWRHLDNPAHYPKIGTVGRVVEAYDDGTALVKWPKYTTSGRGIWTAFQKWLEVVKE